MNTVHGGLCRDLIIGTKPWEWSTSDSQEEVKPACLRCLVLNEAPGFQTEVCIHGRSADMAVWLRPTSLQQVRIVAVYSLHQFLTKISGWHHLMLSERGLKNNVSIGISAKLYLHEKTQKKRLKRMVFFFGCLGNTRGNGIAIPCAIESR